MNDQNPVDKDFVNITEVCWELDNPILGKLRLTLMAARSGQKILADQVRAWIRPHKVYRRGPYKVQVHAVPAIMTVLRRIGAFRTNPELLVLLRELELVTVARVRSEPDRRARRMELIRQICEAVGSEYRDPRPPFEHLGSSF